MKIEDKVKLTDIAEIVIQDLDKQVYALQICQLIVCSIHAEAEEEASISPVDHFVALELCSTAKSASKIIRMTPCMLSKNSNSWQGLYLDKVGVLGVPGCYSSMNIIFHLSLSSVLQRYIILGKPCFACRLGPIILRKQ